MKIILKENSKAIQTLIDRINKNGLKATAEIVGLKMYELLQITNSRISILDATEIFVELLKDGIIPSEYNGFHITYERFYGTVSWSSSNNRPQIDIDVYATPFWEGDDFIPIDINEFTYLNETLEWDNIYSIVGDINIENIIPTGQFENYDEFLNFINKVYYPQVYNIIIKSIMKLKKNLRNER